LVLNSCPLSRPLPKNSCMLSATAGMLGSRSLAHCVEELILLVQSTISLWTVAGSVPVRSIVRASLSSQP